MDESWELPEPQLLGTVAVGGREYALERDFYYGGKLIDDRVDGQRVESYITVWPDRESTRGAYQSTSDETIDLTASLGPGEYVIEPAAIEPVMAAALAQGLFADTGRRAMLKERVYGRAPHLRPDDDLPRRPAEEGPIWRYIGTPVPWYAPADPDTEPDF